MAWNPAISVHRPDVMKSPMMLMFVDTNSAATNCRSMNQLRSLELRERSYEHHLLSSFPTASLHLILPVQRYNISKSSFPDLLQQQAFNN
jgi:hypothetical protein